MAMQFAKATKAQAKARVGLVGPAGSGKTYSALAIAQGLGETIAVIDTENASASKYADEFDFDTLALTDFSPHTYVDAIRAAELAGYHVIVVDSLSHAWMGRGGVLEQVDKASKRYSNNSFMAWRDITPHHNELVNALAHCKAHLIVTMRAKTEYVVEPNEKGRMTPRKVGLAPVQRDGLEYEFDIVADLDLDHNLMVSKTRCRTLDGAVVNKPGAEFGATIRAWLTDGVARPAAPAPSTNGHVDGDEAVPELQIQEPKPWDVDFFERALQIGDGFYDSEEEVKAALRKMNFGKLTRDRVEEALQALTEWAQTEIPF